MREICLIVWLQNILWKISNAIFNLFQTLSLPFKPKQVKNWQNKTTKKFFYSVSFKPQNFEIRNSSKEFE